MTDETNAPAPGDSAPSNHSDSDAPKKKRRRRRRRKPAGEGAPQNSENTERSEDRPPRAEGEGGGGKKRRRRGGGGGGRDGGGRPRRDDGAEHEPKRQRDKTAAVHTAESFDIDKTFADLDLKPDLLEGIEATALSTHQDPGHAHPCRAHRRGHSWARPRRARARPPRSPSPC